MNLGENGAGAMPLVGAFPKEARLRNSQEFRHVLAKGARRGVGGFLLYWIVSGASFSRVGLTVSRKVGNAVVRNRLKRLMREYFRTHRGEWPVGRDYVLIAKPVAGGMDNSRVVAELEKLFRESFAGKTVPAGKTAPASQGKR